MNNKLNMPKIYKIIDYFNKGFKNFRFKLFNLALNKITITDIKNKYDSWEYFWKTFNDDL